MYLLCFCLINFMFFIFKIIPDWFWWLPLIAGIFVYFLSDLSLLKAYSFILKIISYVLVSATIFIFGMLYASDQWKQAVKELEHKVQLAEAQSKTTNKIIAEKVVYKTQVVTKRGDNNIKYVDREVVKYDTTCVIPDVFIQAHNAAAEQPK
jgi:hypothetical protein